VIEDYPAKSQVALKLQSAAARYRLGLLPSTEFPTFAMAALEAGYESRALCELACEPLPDDWEIDSVFERALRDCSVSIPSTEAAVEYVLRFYMQLIASGDLSPWEGMLRIANELYRPYISKEPVLQYAGDQRGLHDLLGSFWSYNDLYARPTEVSFEGVYGPAAIPAFDRHLRQLAKEWLSKHGRNA
jgi:hypothetical protein